MGVTLGSLWDRHCLKKQKKATGKERNAEAAIKQRVLPAQRGALQRGGPHPLRRLLHLRPSTPCTGPPPNLNHRRQRPQQGHGRLLLLLLLLCEAEAEESGLCCSTFARSRTPHSGGRRVILFSLFSSLHL